MTTSTITVAEIDAAIRDLLTGGQEVTVGDRTFRAANLRELQSLRQEAAAKERSDSGNLFVRATFGSIR